MFRTAAVLLVLSAGTLAAQPAEASRSAAMPGPAAPQGPSESLLAALRPALVRCVLHNTTGSTLLLIPEPLNAPWALNSVYNLKAPRGGGAETEASDGLEDLRFTLPAGARAELWVAAPAHSLWFTATDARGGQKRVAAHFREGGARTTVIAP